MGDQLRQPIRNISSPSSPFSPRDLRRDRLPTDRDLIEDVLRAWRRCCVHTRYAREVCLFEEEREALQHELTALRSRRDVCRRNTLEILERSVCAISLSGSTDYFH